MFNRQELFTPTGQSVGSEIAFKSTNHKRVMNNMIVSHDYVPRDVNVNLRNDNKRLIISINPTLSLKAANFERKVDNTYVYIGDDVDFRFHIAYGDNNEIDVITVERCDKGLKLVYFK